MSPRQWGTMATLTPGIPLTTITAAPTTVSAAPMPSRRVRRSPRTRGENRMSATGSTVIRSAALVAVESARPQLPKAKAAAQREGGRPHVSEHDTAHDVARAVDDVAEDQGDVSGGHAGSLRYNRRMA